MNKCRYMFLSTGFYLSYPKIHRPRYKMNIDIHNLNRKRQKPKAFGKVNCLCHAKSICLTNLARNGYLLIRSFATSTSACKRTGKINSRIFPNWLKSKATVNALWEEESNPYTSCQGAVLKEGSISHKAGSLGLVPEGYGTGLQNVYRKNKHHHKKTNPAK